MDVETDSPCRGRRGRRRRLVRSGEDERVRDEFRHVPQASLSHPPGPFTALYPSVPSSESKTNAALTLRRL